MDRNVVAEDPKVSRTSRRMRMAHSERKRADRDEDHEPGRRMNKRAIRHSARIVLRNYRETF